MRKKRKLDDAYRFPGYRPFPIVEGQFGDPKARIIRLQRQGKKHTAALVGDLIGHSMIAGRAGFGTSHVGIPASIWRWRFGVCSVAVVVR